jgi:pSer/pThr/pTyr-binding forkhead associated (FHA) protein/tetratricopeptide (TPR) repeat protein
MPARLLINEGGEVRSYEIRVDKIILGRGQDNEVCVSDGKCSRRHCQIERVDQGFKLVDLESRNGTRCNDAVVNQKLLAHGDVIKIGDTDITFDDGSGRPMDRPRKVETQFPKAEPVKEPIVKEVVKEIKVEGAPRVGVPLTPHADAKMVEAPLASEGTRRTTEANRIMTQRSVDHTRATVNDSASARLQVQEIRRQQEERNLLKSFAIGVGVFFGLIVILIAIQSLTGKPPDRRVSEEALGRASAKYREAEREPEPKFALDLYKQSLGEIEKIRPDFDDLYQRGQELKRTVADAYRVKEQMMHTNEFNELEALEKRGPKAKSLAEIDKLIKDIADFRKKFSSGDNKLHIDSEQRLTNLENHLKAQKGTSKALDFNDLKERIDNSLRTNRFTDALQEANQMVKRFETEPVLYQKSIEMLEEVTKATSKFVETQRAKALELKKQGKKEDAKYIYNNTIMKLGDGSVDAFNGYVELLRNERDH